MMLKKLFFIILLFAGLFIFIPGTLKSLSNLSCVIEPDLEEDGIRPLFEEFGVSDLSYTGFKTAITGFKTIVSTNQDISDNILTLIDYSKPSTEKRLFVIDLTNKKIIYKTYVAHGRNTGLNYAEKFSNLCQSHKTSLGYFITRNTYTGKHGYSLRLEGIEKGINDNALKRAIVMHPAEYVSENYIEQYGRLGRSYGCPSVPVDDHKYLIDLIKENTCLFAYYPDSAYLAGSVYIK